MPSYSVCDGIRFLRWAALYRRSVRATRVSRRQVHVRIISRRLPAGSKAPAKRLYDWQRETNAAGQKLAVACRRRGRHMRGTGKASEKERERMTKTWSRTEGRDVTVPTSSYSHKPPHRPFSSSFLLRLLLTPCRLITATGVHDSITSKLPKASKTT